MLSSPGGSDREKPPATPPNADGGQRHGSHPRWGARWREGTAWSPPRGRGERRDQAHGDEACGYHGGTHDEEEFLCYTTTFPSS